MKNLHSLHNRTHLTILHIFHHLCITAASPLIPCDRTVKVTINQTTYPLTPTRATTTTTPHHIHLFLNPHNRHPYVIHTHRITDQTTRRLELTTTLPSKTSVPGRAQRRPMLRTESHAPDRITTLTFPASTSQHQLSIMTLVTHMLLSVPILNTRQSWNIVRDNEAHEQTLQLIIATITLRSYHKIWSSIAHVPAPLPQATTLDHTPTTQRHNVIPSRPSPSKRRRLT